MPRFSWRDLPSWAQVVVIVVGYLSVSVAFATDTKASIETLKAEQGDFKSAVISVARMSGQVDQIDKRLGRIEDRLDEMGQGD